MPTKKPGVRLQLGRGNRVISYFMLLLFALPSLGLTAVASRSLLGNQRQVEVEEIQERLACSTQRRIQLSRRIASPEFHLKLSKASINISLAVSLPVSAASHRSTGGFLGPMRC